MIWYQGDILALESAYIGEMDMNVADYDNRLETTSCVMKWKSIVMPFDIITFIIEQHCT